MKTTILCTIMLTSALLLGGCAAQGTTHSPSPAAGQPGMSEAQAAAVAKGHISYSAYQAGFRRYIACVAKAGYTIKVLPQTNEIYNIQIPAPAVSSQVEPNCYVKEFKQIDIAWQMSRSDTSPEALAYHACLAAHGVTPTSTEAGMVKQLAKIGITPLQCLNSKK